MERYLRHVDRTRADIKIRLEVESDKISRYMMRLQCSLDLHDMDGLDQSLRIDRLWKKIRLCGRKLSVLSKSSIRTSNIRKEFLKYLDEQQKSRQKFNEYEEIMNRMEGDGIDDEENHSDNDNDDNNDENNNNIIMIDHDNENINNNDDDDDDDENNIIILENEEEDNNNNDDNNENIDIDDDNNGNIDIDDDNNNIDSCIDE